MPRGIKKERGDWYTFLYQGRDPAKNLLIPQPRKNPPSHMKKSPSKTPPSWPSQYQIFISPSKYANAPELLQA